MYHFTFENCILPEQFTYVLRVILTMNDDHSPTQY